MAISSVLFLPSHQFLCGRIHVKDGSGLVTEADGLMHDFQGGSEYMQ
jgi:hypothetical protein